MVSSARGTGLIDKTGQFVVTFDYYAQDYSEGLAQWEKDGKIGFIDKSGQVVIPPQFDEALPFSDGFALVSENDKLFYVDISGEILLLADEVSQPSSYFQDGLAAIEKDGKIGFIDTSGAVVIEPRYTYATPFWNGIALVVGIDGIEYIRKDGSTLWSSSQ